MPPVSPLLLCTEPATAPTVTLWAPAMAAGVVDRRLSHQDRAALVALWQYLSPGEWRPMKTEALAVLLGVKRQSASRTINRLVEVGYLLQHQPDPRAPRLFLLRNTRPD